MILKVFELDVPLRHGPQLTDNQLLVFRDVMHSLWLGLAL